MTTEKLPPTALAVILGTVWNSVFAPVRMLTKESQAWSTLASIAMFAFSAIILENRDLSLASLACLAYLVLGLIYIPLDIQESK